jgi:hypothetical protein
MCKRRHFDEEEEIIAGAFDRFRHTRCATKLLFPLQAQVRKKGVYSIMGMVQRKQNKPENVFYTLSNFQFWVHRIKRVGITVS